jgi:hypothetical protein
MQGLGDGPAGVLVGTGDGRICLVGRHNKCLPLGWALGGSPSRYHQLGVTCLAATDQVVVNGFLNGTLRITKLDASSCTESGLANLQDGT